MLRQFRTSVRVVPVAAGGGEGAFAPGGTFQGAKIGNSENWPFLAN